MRHVHRGPGGYRVWSTMTDTYVTGVLSRGAMMRWLRASGLTHGTVAARIERAYLHGTSQRGHSRDTSRWDTERCACGSLHHDSAPRADGTCSGCGEGVDASAHGACGGSDG